MVMLLLILLLTWFNAPVLSQTNRPADPVEVVELEVFMHGSRQTESPRRPVRSPTPPPGLISVEDIPGRQPQDGKRDPSAVSPTVRVPSGKIPSDGSSHLPRYEYRLRVRNAGAQKIKTILWEYQLRDPSNTSTISSRLFLCAVGLKPGAQQLLTVWTLADPVNASAEGTEPQKQRALINRVEYTDDSVWQRAGWDPADAKRTYAARELRTGQCAAW